MSKRESAKLYRKAAKLVEKGWTKGAYMSAQGKRTLYCAVGALNKCSFDIPDGQRDVGAERIAMEANGFSASLGLIHMNDNLAKTAAEVAKVLRTTARIIEHGGKLV